VDAGDHARQLQVRVFEQLLAAGLPGRAGLDQVPAVAGMGAQPPDVFGGHEAARQGAPPGDLRQPDRVQLVRLGPPGQRLDLRGVIQHALEALPLQQEVHRLPVIAGCLHPGLGHLPAAQPVRQRQQVLADGPELPRLLLPAATRGVTGHPDGHHDRGFADVDSGDPLAEKRLVFYLFRHELLC